MMRIKLIISAKRNRQALFVLLWVLCINGSYTYHTTAQGTNSSFTNEEILTKSRKEPHGSSLNHRDRHVWGRWGHFKSPDVPAFHGNRIESIFHLMNKLSKNRKRIEPKRPTWRIHIRLNKHTKNENPSKWRHGKTNKLHDEMAIEEIRDRLIQNSKMKSAPFGSGAQRKGEASSDVSSVRNNHGVPVRHRNITSHSYGSFTRKEFFDITKAKRMWIGVAVGACGSLVVVMVMGVIYLLLRKRSRSSKLRELSLDTSQDEKPIYIKLSQLHHPKRSPNYVVTVLDESNFSINSEDTSEEELFDISAICKGSPCKDNMRKNNILSYQNVTSTPKKDNVSKQENVR